MAFRRAREDGLAVLERRFGKPPDYALEWARILASAADPGVLAPNALALACVVHSARRRAWPVLTGNAAALQALDPKLGIDELP